MNDTKRMLTGAEVAKFLRISLTTLRRWSDNGNIPSYRIGARGDRRFRREDLDRYLKERQQ